MTHTGKKFLEQATQPSTSFIVPCVWAFHRKNRNWTSAWTVFLIRLRNELNQKWTIHEHNSVWHLFPVKMISEQMAQIKTMELLNPPQIPIISDVMITEHVWGQHTAFLSPDPVSCPLGIDGPLNFKAAFVFSDVIFNNGDEMQWEPEKWPADLRTSLSPHPTVLPAVPGHEPNEILVSPMKSWWSLQKPSAHSFSSELLELPAWYTSHALHWIKSN